MNFSELKIGDRFFVCGRYFEKTGEKTAHEVEIETGFFMGEFSFHPDVEVTLDAV
jgi:hypothetical protein